MEYDFSSSKLGSLSNDPLILLIFNSIFIFLCLYLTHHSVTLYHEWLLKFVFDKLEYCLRFYCHIIWRLDDKWWTLLYGLELAKPFWGFEPHRREIMILKKCLCLSFNIRPKNISFHIQVHWRDRQWTWTSHLVELMGGWPTCWNPFCRSHSPSHLIQEMILSYMTLHLK